MSDFSWKEFFIGNDKNFKKRGDFKSPDDYINYLKSSEWDKDHNRSHLEGYPSLLGELLDHVGGVHQRFGDEYQKAVRERDALEAYNKLNNSLKRRINNDKSISYGYIPYSDPKLIKKHLETIKNGPYPLDIYNGLVDKEAGKALIEDALINGLPMHLDEHMK